VVLSEFTNGKNGNLMYLRVITPGNKFTSVASGQGEESTPCYGGLVKGVPDCGPIVRFENNRTYHVVLTYDDSDKQVSMAVSDKSLGRQVWGYFVKINDLLSGMKRIYLGSVGDNRDITNRYAEGYIDNVKLYTNEISPAGTPEPTVASPTRVQTTVTARTTKPTVKPTLAEPTETPSSPLSLWLIIAALGLLGIASAVRKNR
jgi:hypothetical protein